MKPGRGTVYAGGVMTRNLFEFHAADPSILPAPFPAARGVPQWLKDMPMDRPYEMTTPQGPRTIDAPTVKRCPPFIEAMTCGYLIPLPGDVTLTREANGSVSFKSMGHIVDTQHPLQVRDSPMQGMPIVKFINPWVIRTPPGYSTLFLHPLNHFGLPFQALSGLVETDTYYRPVHFPTLCLLRPGQSATLKRGTPIVQVIPIPREEWQSQTAPWDEGARKQIEQEMLEDRTDFYKDRHWKKKSYG